MPVERISVKAFNSAISEFRSSVSEYVKTRNDFFRATDMLFVDWIGEGKDKFEKNYILLKTQLKDEEDGLRAIADNLEKICLSYTEMDQTIASQLKSSQ